MFLSVGHDGSASVPENPFGRRCFYDTEIVYVAFKWGVHLVPFVAYLEIPGKGHEHIVSSPTIKRLSEQFFGLFMGSERGRGIGHAVAWKDGHIHDPRTGERMSLERFNERYNVEVFYAWVNRPQEFSPRTNVF